MTAVNKRGIAVGVTLLLFLGVVGGSLLLTPWAVGESVVETSNFDLGLTVFEQYGIVVLMVGFVLFASMLGGVFIAQEEEK